MAAVYPLEHAGDCLPTGVWVTTMFLDVLMLATAAAATYACLCAIVAPLVGALRNAIRRPGARACAAVALAAGGALLWTIIPAGAALLLMICEPRLGLAFVGSPAPVAGPIIGGVVWLAHAAWSRALPRLGPGVETATALAIVAMVRDDDATLGRVELLYREMALAPLRTSPSSVSAVRIAA